MQLKKFRHLHIPDSWQHYWTKYPEGYTILESLMSWVSQVDEMITSLNLTVDEVNKLSAEITKEIDRLEKEIREKLDKLFGEEMAKELDKILTAWLEDGALGGIINDVLFETKADKEEVFSYTDMPQSTQPNKQGVCTGTFKIIKKTEDKVDIIQKTNKGYVHHTFQQNTGANDWDNNHGLLRLVNTTYSVGAYVFYDLGTPKSGELTPGWEPAQYGSIEEYLYGTREFNNIDTTRNLNDGVVGAGTNTIKPGTTIKWDMPITTGTEKYHITVLATPGSTKKAVFKINGVVIKEVDISSYASSTGATKTTFLDIEIPVPKVRYNANASTGGVNFELEISNEGSGNILLIGANFCELADYKGQPINRFKTIGTDRQFLTGGANDYAIRDYEKGVLFGSYHGGETSDTVQMYFNKLIYPNGTNKGRNTNMTQIDNGEWCVLDDFYIYQRTTLAGGKAKMISNFSFSTDGTIDMRFSYSSDDLIINSFRTAMVCTHTDFRHLTEPIYNIFPVEPTETFYYIPTVEGLVTQVNSTGGLQLTTRFTKLNAHNEKSGAFIADRKAYRKFYYGPLDNTKPIVLKNLNFTKSLDFIIRS